MGSFFRFIGNNLKLGLLAMIVIALVAPFWKKPFEAYEDFGTLVGTMPWIGHFPVWAVFLTATFLAGIVVNIFWWFLVIYRFRHFVEVKYYPNTNDPDVFELGLGNGIYAEKDGTMSDVCYIFLDFFLPKGFPRFARAGSGRIVPTGRSAKQHIWSVLKYWFGINCFHLHECDCQQKYGKR